MDADFLQACQPGKTLARYYGPDNLNNATLHIRAIVDDNQVVYRMWVQRRRMWDYRVVALGDLYYMWEYGTLGVTRDRLKGRHET